MEISGTISLRWSSHWQENPSGQRVIVDTYLHRTTEEQYWVAKGALIVGGALVFGPSGTAITSSGGAFFWGAIGSVAGEGVSSYIGPLPPGTYAINFGVKEHRGGLFNNTTYIGTPSSYKREYYIQW